MLWLSLFLLLSGGIESPGGRIVQLRARGFSFQVLEPEGWTLETGAARQIADFLFTPAGENWRNADAVIFARFVRRSPDQTLDDFLEEGRTQFLMACPGGEDDALENPLDSSVEPFIVRVYDCPKIRREIVATTTVPRYFVVFALSSQDPGKVKATTPVLEEILKSFRWFEGRSDSYWFPGSSGPTP